MKRERLAAYYHLLLATGLALGGQGGFQSGDPRGFEGPKALGGAVATAKQLDRFGWVIQTRQRFWPFNSF